MNAFPIGLSAITTAQRGLDLVGQNLANASTPGYSRQTLALANRASYADPIGTGVEVQSYVRTTAPTLRSAILSGQAVDSAVSARVSTRQQIESALGNSASSLGTQIDGLFSQIAQLSTNPTSTALRGQVTQAASDLGQQFQSIAGAIQSVRQSDGQTIGQQVTQVNTYAKQIADLNSKISVAQISGNPANDLQDQRDNLVNSLSQLIDVKTVPQPNGAVNVLSSGTPVVLANTPIQFQASYSGASLNLTTVGSTQPISVAGGSIGGLLTEYNTAIPANSSRLDALAQKLIQGVNSVQSTGLGSNGPQTTSVGSTSVTDPTATLASQNLAIPVQAGNLVISITDASGKRTNTSVAINPATQSLNDVAAAITSATGGKVQASVDTPQNVLRFQAQSGYSFDFAGRVPNPPNAVSIGGTSTPTVSGAYTGSSDDNYSFQITGSGTIGTTAGLSLQVKNAANQVVTTANIGTGYTPGSPIDLGNGVSVSLGAGTTNNGSFSAPLTANPDRAGLLTGLGVGGLFQGTSASDIAVNPNIAADPSLLAASRTGDSGDTSNLTKFAALQDQTQFAGTRTYSQEFTDFAASVGSDVKSLTDQQSSQEGINSSLSAQEQSVTGVDINEETVQLLTYQRMVDAGSKYIATVNTALDSVLAIIQ